jgi:hypothetical protein
MNLDYGLVVAGQVSHGEGPAVGSPGKLGVADPRGAPLRPE